MKKLLLTLSLIFIIPFNVNANAKINPDEDRTYIDLVQNGVLNDYKTTTIGMAFDNWSSCEDTFWEQIRKPNGTMVVQYECYYDMDAINRKGLNRERVELMGIFVQFNINMDKTFQLNNISVFYKNVTKDIGTWYRTANNNDILYLIYNDIKVP